MRELLQAWIDRRPRTLSLALANRPKGEVEQGPRLHSPSTTDARGSGQTLKVLGIAVQRTKVLGVAVHLAGQTSKLLGITVPVSGQISKVIGVPVQPPKVLGMPMPAPKFSGITMNATKFLGAVVLALGLALSAAPRATALDRAGFTMEVLVDGRPIQELYHDGTIYIEASRGREYSVRLRNMTGARIAVALSVDGLNSIDAKTTSADGASKWILGPWETITLDGWQTSSSTARRFFFTSEARSYGAWLGSTKNLGVISAAVFRERVRPVPYSRLYPYQEGGGRDSRSGAPRDRSSSYPDRPEPLEESDRLAAVPRANDGPPEDASETEEHDAEPAEPGRGGADTQNRGQAASPGAQGTRDRQKAERKDASGNEEGSASETYRKSEIKKSSKRLSDELAATGIGQEIGHEVRRIEFDAEPEPAAVLEVRYEYRDALVRLGVLPRPCCDPGDPLARREQAHGFEDGGFAPDPYARKKH